MVGTHAPTLPAQEVDCHRSGAVHGLREDPIRWYVAAAMLGVRDAGVEGSALRRAHAIILAQARHLAESTPSAKITGSMKEFTMVETILSQARGMLGEGINMHKLQRQLVAHGHKGLANRLRKLSSARNSCAHPDTTLLEEVGDAIQHMIHEDVVGDPSSALPSDQSEAAAGVVPTLEALPGCRTMDADRLSCVPVIVGELDVFELLSGMVLQTPVVVAGGLFEHSDAHPAHDAASDSLPSGTQVPFTSVAHMIVKAKEASLYDDWCRNPVEFQPGTEVDVVNAWRPARRRGRILRAGYGIYSDYYRVHYEHGDQWAYRWLCVAPFCR